MKYSDLESTIMDKWNLHTFTEHGISPDKIKICCINSSYKMLDILNYALSHTNIDTKEIVKIGRVLTLERGKGVGKELLTKSLTEIKNKMKCKKIIMDAQKHAVGFY